MAASVRAACSRMGAAAPTSPPCSSWWAIRAGDAMRPRSASAAEAAQRLGRATMQGEQTVRRQPVEQGVANERVPEAVARCHSLDDTPNKRLVKKRIGLRLANAG